MAQKQHYRIISLRILCELAGIPYSKVRNTIASIYPRYNSLTDNEKTQLSNKLFTEVQKIFKDMGCRIKIV